MEKFKLVLALQACALVATACGGGSSDGGDAATSNPSSSGSSTVVAATTSPVVATTTVTPSTGTTSSSGTTSTTTTPASPSVTAAAGTITATTSTVAGAVSLHWATPTSNATVSGTVTVKLTGQAFKNVEVFDAGVKVATASVASDSTSASATIDTTQFANGALALTAHGWNSAAGTEFTSDADAGTLNLVVSNAAAAVAATATTSTSGTQIGVNIHEGGGNATNNQKIADVLNARHLTTVRMDFTLDSDLTNVRDQVTRLKAYGIKAETSLQPSYQWDHSCNQNFTAVEADAYSQTVTLVQRIGDLIQDFELLNEVTLRPETAAQVAPYQATAASGYAGKSCYGTMAAVLRGMARAIADQRTASGRPLRSILGAVSNDFGFLDFMQQQGVAFDVVGYHAYPSLNNPLVATDSWYGAGGPLAQLAKYNKPVHLNEFNCGETYSSSFDNVAGSGMTNTCLSSIQKHLASLMTQKIVNLESVHVYELLDESSKGAPENHFGLMYDLNTPKLQLALYATFASGTVSAAEKQLLTSLGLTGR